MNVFYNEKGIGDCLLIPFKQGDRYQTSFERFGDVVRIIDTQTEEVLGYNIFQASTYFTLGNGKIPLTEDLLKSIKDVFAQNNLTDSLDIDLSPKFVVGYVKEKSPHENADKLNVCQVDIGDVTTQIVCGAPNVEADQFVVVAKVGAIMPSGMEIKEANLRGVDSFGMICSQKELGLPNAPKEKGIYVLTEDVKAGQAFIF